MLMIMLAGQTSQSAGSGIACAETAIRPSQSQ
jgi:hypothetical protein